MAVPTWKDQLPTWYELFITANGKYQEFDEVEFPSPVKVIEEAKRLVVELDQEMDVGSWEVRLLPHWCERGGPCPCDVMRTETRPYAEYKGMVLPLDFKGSE